MNQSISTSSHASIIRAPKLDIREQVASLDDLPMIPEMALRILELQDDADATVDQLASIIQMDPALSAQLIRYANSPLYGQRSSVDTLEDAIFRVLGFETVLYIALGSTLSQAFHLPRSGPIGLKTFWQNAVFSAALVQKLASQHQRQWQIKPGTAYLCALLHNIGYLVLATLFESEYFWLNKVIEARPDTAVVEIEKQLLGISHTELGKYLLESWHLPKEIVTVASEHHNLGYEGKHSDTVRLIQVTDQLLRSHKMSDADTDEISTGLCQKLGLDDSEIYLAMDDVLESSSVLNSMAKSFSNT